MKQWLVVLNLISTACCLFTAPSELDLVEPNAADYYKSSLDPIKLWNTFVTPRKLQEMRDRYSMNQVMINFYLQNV